VKILVFTDGGGFKREDEGFDAVSVFRIFTENPPSKDFQPLVNQEFVIERKTSAYAEIYAIAKALENVFLFVEEYKKPIKSVNIYTDSMLCYKSLTEWIYSWMKKSKDGTFYSSNGTPVANQEEIKTAFSYMGKLRNRNIHTKFFHINSHTAQCKVKTLKKKFEKFNRCAVTDEEFLFYYLQNKKCDEAVKKSYEEYKIKKN